MSSDNFTISPEERRMLDRFLSIHFDPYFMVVDKFKDGVVLVVDAEGEHPMTVTKEEGETLVNVLNRICAES